MVSFEYPWFLVLPCLAVGVAYAWLLYRRGDMPRWLRWLLAGVRGLAVSLVALLLLGPIVSRTVHERQRPVLLLAQDVSGSVAQSADSAFSLRALQERLGDRFEVYYSEFGNADYTDLASALSDPSLPRPDAVVLASDGIFNRGASPVAAAERLGSPLFVVMLGDTSVRRDAALLGLRANRFAFLGNSFRLELTVSATRLAGRPARLSVSRGDRLLVSTVVDYSSDAFSSTVGLDLPADEPGLQTYSVTLAPVDGEFTADNNRAVVYVDVVDMRRHVAIVAAAPHPDLSALRAAIAATPDFDADLFLASSSADMERFARSADDYSLLLVHNLPSASLQPRLPELPTLYVVGLQTDLARFNALHTGLEIVARSRKVNEVTALWNERFSLFSLDEATARALEQMPPLQAPFGEPRVAQGVQSLFTARLGSLDTRQPLVAASTGSEGRRSALVWGEGLWRWRLADYQTGGSFDRFDRLVAQLLSFTALSEGRNRLQVNAERRYPAATPIDLRAVYFNQALQPSTDPEVVLQLTGDSLDARYTFARSASGYSLRLPPLPEGVYHYVATADDQSASGSFAVEALHLEQQRLQADHALMRAMADATGGRAFLATDAGAASDAVVDALAAVKPVIHTHRRPVELSSLGWLLALLLALFAAEWVTRKYNGSL